MSKSAEFVNFLLRTLKFNRMFLAIEGSKGDKEGFTQIVTKARAKEDRKNPPVKLFKEYEIKKRVIGNNAVHFLRRKNGKNKKIIIYFHGGAYVKGPLALQWKALSEIADATAYDVAVPDYPKTPEYTYKETVEHSVQVFEEILHDYGHENIVFLGDSAGGGLALSLCMNLRNAEKLLPEKMILLSPWLDVSMSNKGISEYSKKDLILTVDGLIECGKYYAGKTNQRDWRVSPLYGDLKGLPITHVFVGGSEVFYPDCREFVRKAQENGCLAMLHFYEGMQHDWPIIPLIPEAKQARDEIIDLIR